MNIQFAESDWRSLERDWSAFWVGELDRPLLVLRGFEPRPGRKLPEVHRFLANYPLDTPVDEILDRYQPHLEGARFYGDSWPCWWPNFGPGIVAAFLGANVNSVPETVWFSPAQPISAKELHLTYDPDNVWWRRVRDITERAVERWGRRVCIKTTDLGGNLDILASLLGTEQLLFALRDAPEEVKRLIGEVTSLWIRYYDELHEIIRQAGRGTSPWAPIWSPGRCYMLQSDFSYMISPEMFERFVVPDLQGCCGALDHGFYHLDGEGQIVHLDLLLSIERLRGIQWIPGAGNPPADRWLPLLKRIKDGGKVCQVYVSPEGALDVVRNLGGRGFIFELATEMKREEAEEYLRVLSAEDRSTT